MVDYGEAVVRAVAAMLSEGGRSQTGIANASRKGADRSLSGKVGALRAWLEREHGEALLHAWDPDRRIGLPEYVKGWSTCPLRGQTLPTEWNAAWSCFHETHVKPILDEQRLSGGKRQHGTVSVDFNDIEELLSPEVPASVRSRTDIPIHVDSDLHVNGHVYAKGVCLVGADNAEMFE